jgi:hypothetical protein
LGVRNKRDETHEPSVSLTLGFGNRAGYPDKASRNFGAVSRKAVPLFILGMYLLEGFWDNATMNGSYASGFGTKKGQWHDARGHNPGSCSLLLWAI